MAPAAAGKTTRGKVQVASPATTRLSCWAAGPPRESGATRRVATRRVATRRVATRRVATRRVASQGAATRWGGQAPAHSVVRKEAVITRRTPATPAQAMSPRCPRRTAATTSSMGGRRPNAATRTLAAELPRLACGPRGAPRLLAASVAKLDFARMAMFFFRVTS
eukprot:CAMPEP_0117523804 /NCGR_PEP_ID=MMETSP0784-20121206/34916_1 /TAXON_ID=39447 /ORGANISM="" /LENGTH=164 /DNA_ID=CAMNT_0005319927 /DNA_START=30 /DNA_END=521 /DNA_ORIENTATION=-